MPYDGTQSPQRYYISNTTSATETSGVQIPRKVRKSLYDIMMKAILRER